MRRLWTPAWLARHAIALILVASFLGLGWWQVRRAAEGNLLSYAYAIEWPVFAGFVIFVWFKELQGARRGPAPERGVAAQPEPAERPEPGARREPAARPKSGAATRPPVVRTLPPPVAAYDDSDDAELAAYNRYLAWLNAHPQASPSDYRPELVGLKEEKNP